MIQYTGEQLIWGKIGNLFIFIAFTSSILSCISFFYSYRTEVSSWKSLARKAFAIHTACILGIFGLLFYLILHQRLEYYYVWEHSNSIMPLRYILSCFWEGQEGSFLLWMFWQCVLSWLVIAFTKEWESSVMFIITLVQVFLSSMILGVVILNYKIGSNPFILLREHPDFSNLPFIHMPDYLSKIKDGRGLNPLLQNYWMTIHPPTLFLGFASTVVPFAFCMAGLLRKKFTEWIRPALPWTFFGIMILGTGILMGAAWAYESLSFGGFWAWDPVENASLVPWLTLTGLGHVMLIYNHRQRSLLSCYVLGVLTFFLILYSTFLTRSGILGTASVHAFTDLGMSGQLVFYMLFFLVLAVTLMIKHRKHIHISQEEESGNSREFWMFIGAFVLVAASMQIISTTSTPVVNKVFGTSIAPPADPVAHYNQWQVPIALIVCLLLGIGQFFRYRESDTKKVLKKIMVCAIIAAVITTASGFILGNMRVPYYGLLFAGIFAITSNGYYFFTVLKGKLKNSGASIAHIGIGFIICGALISNAKKEIISRNVKNIDLGKDMPNHENIMIEQKNDTLPMGEYYVAYTAKNKVGVNIYYSIDYFKLNRSTGVKEKQFELNPVVQLNERMGNVAEPATKHFLTRDIYTHITYANLEKKNNDESNEFQASKTNELAIGDTFVTSNSFVILQQLDKNIDKHELNLGDSDLVVGARLLIEDVNKKTYSTEPLFIIHDFSVYSKDTLLDPLGLKFEFTKINPENGKISLTISERKMNKPDFVIMKAIIFPGINLLWLGCILMIIGSLVALRKRIFLNKSPKS